MPTDADFLARILDRPADDTPRLMLADHLDETAVAVACGACVGVGKVPEYEPGTDGVWRVVRNICQRCGGTGSVPDGRAARAAFIRVQCELARGCDPWCRNGVVQEPVMEYRENAGGVVAVGQRNVPCPKCWPLRRREQELLNGNAGRVLSGAAWLAGDRQESYPLYASLRPVYRRGFVADLHCPLADWQEHAGTILAAHPVERVEFTDTPGDDFTDYRYDAGTDTIRSDRWPGVVLDWPLAGAYLAGAKAAMRRNGAAVARLLGA